ncbi:O-Antigen ligase [compost metagenome]|jgi:O-antigen ligase|uniref:O-antigen ligase family protein n=1 Tax=Pseudomonas TaxID=286 RepID=UPI00098193F2|nr:MULTISPECIES: O-antigen ligase family protein [Pseudomonas]MCK8657051.1 O-antigen ligase family protein [Pseudomonas umsongensis]NBB61093.1 O-antigen ligase domain-containing protein [Pseudomonas sp. ODNR1LW]OMQ41288.1 ligase [Pseudomonas putida]
MPEHFRALVVILVLAGIVFAFARRPAADLIPHSDFTRRRNLWFALTLLAFFSHSFWVYAAVTAVILTLTRQRERNPLALFFFLLFLIPPATAQIPGFGVVNYLFDLNHVRLLILCVLLPAFLALRRRSDTLPFGRTLADKLLLAYLLLTAALFLRQTTPTDTLRQSLYLFVDVFLPYYVASRALKNVSEFKDAMLGFLLAAMVMSLIGLFEFTRRWLLYNALTDAMGMQWEISSYLSRGGSLRASVTTGQAIALGYVIAVAIGFYLFLQEGVRSKMQRRLGALLLAGGLFAPLSRGPWIGAAVMIIMFIGTGRYAVKRLMLLGIAAVLALPLLAILPGGQKVLDLLPFIGSVETENITYRHRLIENSMIVIQRNLWLGSFDYRSTPEMQALTQGQGIIDIVNTYVAIALQMGVIGLTLFVGFFATIALGIRKAMRSYPNKDDEARRLGRALLATLAGILITIITVSSITVIPVVYWSVAGLGVSYAQMARKLKRAEIASNKSTLLQTW